MLFRINLFAQRAALGLFVTSKNTLFHTSCDSPLLPQETQPFVSDFNDFHNIPNHKSPKKDGKKSRNDFENVYLILKGNSTSNCKIDDMYAYQMALKNGFFLDLNSIIRSTGQFNGEGGDDGLVEVESVIAQVETGTKSQVHFKDNFDVLAMVEFDEVEVESTSPSER